MPVTHHAATERAGDHLRRLRTRHRISQLELSLRVGVSQRHLSCIETGRSKASRPMLLAVLEALDAPLPERNRTLLAAGFAPAYGERSLQQNDMAPIREAIAHLLAAHDPAPALVIDGLWNVLTANRAAHRLIELIGADPAPLDGGGFNLLRGTFAEGGLKAAFINADEVCGSVWRRAEREAPHVEGLAALLDELRPHAPPARDAGPAADTPLLFTRIRSAAGELRFFSAFTTFGAPLDVTIASLRIEHLFPADDATRQALAAG